MVKVLVRTLVIEGEVTYESGDGDVKVGGGITFGIGDVAGNGVVQPFMSNRISEAFARFKNIADMRLSVLYPISEAILEFLKSPRAQR